VIVLPIHDGECHVEASRSERNRLAPRVAPTDRDMVSRSMTYIFGWRRYRKPTSMCAAISLRRWP